jgi:hypothetical protein
MFCFRQRLYSCWLATVRTVLKVRVKVFCGKKRNLAPLTDKLAQDGSKWSTSSPGRFIHTHIYIHMYTLRPISFRTDFLNNITRTIYRPTHELSTINQYPITHRVSFDSLRVITCLWPSQIDSNCGKHCCCC